MSDTPAEFGVVLNLEESGWICHALMAKILEDRRASNEVMSGTLSTPHVIRYMNLYDRIAMANDILIGKRREAIDSLT